MANKNTKQRVQAAHDAHKEGTVTTTFSVPKKISGNRAYEYTTRDQAITVSSKPLVRKSRKPKVAGSAASYSR